MNWEEGTAGVMLRLRGGFSGFVFGVAFALHRLGTFRLPRIHLSISIPPEPYRSGLTQ